MTVMIEVSHGEFVDRMTILEIKAARIQEPAKLTNIRRELAALAQVWARVSATHQAELQAARAELKTINERLWDIEDAIRLHERMKNFDTTFIELARSVYITNDRRAGLKKRIDALLGSRFSEEKSYQSY